MITVDHVSVSFQQGPERQAFEALKDVSFEIRSGETLCLIGPSGCGKTTTLRLINRMIEPTHGRVLVDGEDVARQDPIPLRRGIGYVIQSGGLFPHLDVRGNIGLLCRLQDWKPSAIRERVDELLELVRLDPAAFAGRYPSQLSGGQRQRVGVARALALDPAIVLMDEPFGALDPMTRSELQDEFAELSRRLRKTVVVVTHDLSEAFLLGDRIGVMFEGGLQRLGTRAELTADPGSPLVARYLERQAHAL